MSNTLTDRYVWAVTQRLPSGQRPDIEAELRSTIADMAEGVGEREALVELGEPAMLAASYRNKGRVLISELHYPDYVRHLRLWLVVAVPLLAALAAVGAATADESTVGSVMLGVLEGATTAVFQVCFWVTLVFVMIDRLGTDESPETIAQWDPDDLPAVPARPRVTVADTAGEVVTTLILISLLFIQRTWSPVHESNGEPVPLLDPDLWSGPIWAVIALLVAGAVVAVAAHIRGAWSWPLALATTAIDLVLLAIVAWASFAEVLVNPAFLSGLSDELDLGRVLQPTPILITAIVGAVLLWDAWEALSAAGRSRFSDDPGQQLR